MIEMITNTRRFTLPTAMDEMKTEDPVIYKWLVENKYEAYYDSKSNLMVRSEDNDFEDMSFKFFAAITIGSIKRMKARKAK